MPISYFNLPILEIVKAIFNPSLLKPKKYVESINNIKPENLKRQNITNIIFDLDQTLALHEQNDIYDEYKDTFAALSRQFTICGLSNPPNLNEQDQHKIRYEVIENKYDFKIIRPQKKKPKKDGFVRSMEYLKSTPDNTAMVGDRLLTDILGANILGLYTILVDPIEKKSDPNLLVSLPRYLERILITRIGMNRGERYGKTD